MTISQVDTVGEYSKANAQLEELLGSETRAKILRCLFLSEGKEFTLTEISKLTKLDLGGIHREIAKLIDIGLVKSNQVENKQKYAISKHHLFYNGLADIMKKTSSLMNFYFLLEELPVAFPMLACTFMNVNNANSVFEKSGLKAKISHSLSVYEGIYLKIYFYDKEFKALSKEILEKLKIDPEFGIKDTKEVLELSRGIFELTDEIEKKDYTKFSDTELINLFKEYFAKYEKNHIYGWIQNASDIPDMLFTKHLLFLLKEKIREKGSLLNPQDAFSKLTTPNEDSYMQKEYEGLLNILKEIRSNKDLEDIFRNLEPRNILKSLHNLPMGKRITKHAHEFGWLGYGYIGPNWDEIYFIGILASLIRQNTDANKSLKEIETKKQELINDQNKMLKSLNFDEKTQRLFEVAKSFIFAKGYRKDSMFKYLSRIEPIYTEIARRIHVSINDIRFCYPHEIDSLMKLDSRTLKKIRERQQASIYESTGKLEEDLYLEGEESKEYLKELNFEKESETDVSVLNGTCACPGRVRGTVKIINLPGDMKKMDKGDILISITTMPDLVPAMKKAAAIVTDAGGITSHAAIVSRELNIPCVVGTKIATKALKDGYFVDVDATHGIVRIIKKF